MMIIIILDDDNAMTGPASDQPAFICISAPIRFFSLVVGPSVRQDFGRSLVFCPSSVLSLPSPPITSPSFLLGIEWATGRRQMKMSGCSGKSTLSTMYQRFVCPPQWIHWDLAAPVASLSAQRNDNHSSQQTEASSSSSSWLSSGWSLESLLKLWLVSSSTVETTIFLKFPVASIDSITPQIPFVEHPL